MFPRHRGNGKYMYGIKMILDKEDRPRTVMLYWSSSLLLVSTTAELRSGNILADDRKF